MRGILDTSVFIAGEQGRTLRVEHLPDDVFAPVLPGVYTAGATTLRFTVTASGTPSRMTVDSARTTGFSFSACR